MCQPPSTACNTISYSYKPTSKNPNYPFKGDAAVCKIILAHTPSQFLKSEEMPTEPCQATVSKTKIVGRLSKASDHPSLLLLIKRGVKINILCGLQKQSLKSTCSGWKNMVSKLKDKKKAWRQNENIPSYHSVSVSDGGCCYSNRTVIKASISSHSHTSTHSLSKHTHTCMQRSANMLCFSHPPLVHQGVCVYGRGGYKIILNYTFVTWKAFCLLCMSSSSLINSAILTFQLLIIHKTSTPLCLFYLCLPPFHFPPSSLWSSTVQSFHLSVLMYACQIQ